MTYIYIYIILRCVAYQFRRYVPYDISRFRKSTVAVLVMRSGFLKSFQFWLHKKKNKKIQMGNGSFFSFFFFGSFYQLLFKMRFWGQGLIWKNEPLDTLYLQRHHITNGSFRSSWTYGNNCINWMITCCGTERELQQSTPPQNIFEEILFKRI